MYLINNRAALARLSTDNPEKLTPVYLMIAL